jgi:voltage-gated potassium channel Kch
MSRYAATPMPESPFVTIRCPSCGAGDVRALEHGRFACGHCQSSFLYTGARDDTGARDYTGARDAPMSNPARRSGSGGALVAVVALVLLGLGAAVFLLFLAPGNVAPEHSAVVAVDDAQRPLAVAEASRPVVAPPRSVPIVPSRAAEPKAIAPAEDPALEPSGDTEPPMLADFQELHGCACAKGVARLHVRSTGRTTTLSGAGLTIMRQLEFAVLAADASLWRMPSTASSAPADSYAMGDISMGVGCKGDLLVVAAGMQASAWSLSRHELLWSHALEAPFGKYATGAGDEMSIDCSTLRLGKQTVSLRAGKRKVELALTDGSAR